MMDKIAIVTGGSRGIGRAIVVKLASEGYHVAFNFQSNKDAALSLKQEVEAKGVRCHISQTDISDFAAVKLWIDQVKEEFGRIDVLINNAGIIRDKPLMMMSEDDWCDVINVNLNGLFHATRCCIVSFMKQKGGNIINISSVSGIIGLKGQTNYSASKGAMNAFTKALAKEVGGFGVRVNAVAAGFIGTEMLSKFKAEQMDEIVKSIPLLRIGTPQDVANCVDFLLSDSAQYITGQILQVDGGLVMR